MEIDRLIRQKGHIVDIYERSQVRGYRGSNKFIFTQLNHPLEEFWDYCTVEETVPGVWRVETKGAVEPRNVAPVNFLDILMEWGCEWMWEGIQVVVGTDWLGEAIEDESLVTVTDGSFIE